MAYGIDRWFAPVTIETGVNDTYVLIEGGINYDITVPAGTYWPYASSSPGNDLAGYPSLYRAMVDAQGGIVGGTYDFQSAQPEGTSLTDYRAIKLVRTAGGGTGALSWGIAFNDLGFDFPKTLFGKANTFNTALTVGSGVDEIGPFDTVSDTWISTKPAERKVPRDTQMVSLSTSDTARDDLYAMRWTSRRQTIFTYRRIPAGWVRAGANADADYAGVVGATTGDARQEFERMWRALTRYDDILVLHDDGAAADAFSAQENYATSLEVIRLAGSEAAQDFRNVAEVETMGGEFYRITVPAVRIGGGYVR